MTKLELEIHDDIIATLLKIKSINDVGVEIVIPEGSVLFDNIINLKLLKQKIIENGQNLIFNTKDENGQNLINMLEENNANSGMSSEIEPETPQEIEKREFKLPSFNMPKFNTSQIKGTKIGLIALGFALIITYLLIGKSITLAKTKVVLTAQPLTRSITIKIREGSSNEAANKILKGTTMETSVEDSAEQPTTGEILIGEKAKGEITLYNKKLEEITLKKNTELTLKDTKDETIKFSLNEETKIPAAVDNTSTITAGEKVTKVTALDIGTKFNIDKDKELSVKNFKSSELVAIAKADFEGGKSEKSKAVIETDITNLRKTLTTQITEQAKNSLKKKLGVGQKLIEDSVTTTINKETFSAKVGEKTDLLILSQTASAQGLYYSTADLDALLDNVVKDLVPEGYKLSEKKRDVKVDILGKTDSTSLSSQEADIQVTLKTFVVPNVNETDISQNIQGKTVTEAQKYISSLRNLKSYEFNIFPKIPFFTNVPKDSKKIEVEITYEQIN